MQFNTQRKVYLGVFLTALVALGADRFLLSGGASPVASAEAAAPEVAAAKPVSAEARAALLLPVVGVGEQLRGRSASAARAASAFAMPMAWAAATAAAKPAAKVEEHAERPLSARLTSIVRGADGWRAIVNGRTVRVGESVDGWVASVMAARSVVFRRDGREVTLALSEAGR